MSKSVCLFLSVLGAAYGLTSPSVKLPLVDFGDLVSLSEGTALSVVHALTSMGALQITGIPNYDQLRQNALGSLAECLHEPYTQTPMRQTMPDGSLRLTTVASSVHGEPRAMSSSCGASAESLRYSTDLATKQLFMALDRARKLKGGSQPVMSPYQSYEDVVRYGEHLEHLHAYFSPDKQSPEQQAERTSEYHTDAGLLIAMTTGYYSGEAPSAESGLYVELPTGVRAKADLQDDALVILVGDGGARWLSPAVGAPLRAVPHALVAGLKVGSGSTRSWYGKMFLPPGDAVIPQEGVSFQQFQLVHSKAVVAAQAAGDRKTVEASQTLPSACGGASSGHRYYSLVSEATPCTVDGEAGIECWMRCMSVAGLSCGQNAVCENPATGEVVDGDTVTCPTCVPMCVIEPNPDAVNGTDDSAGSQYCYGVGVTMYMLGFTSIAKEAKGSTECIALMFSEWTLDKEWKFGLACAGTLLMGLLIQFLTMVRRDFSLKKVSNFNNAVLVVLHSAQVVLGYFAMLIAMTYSVELFCMVCLGLSIGFALFNIKAPVASSTDPCCPPDPEEANSLNRPLIFTSSPANNNM